MVTDALSFGGDYPEIKAAPSNDQVLPLARKELGTKSKSLEALGLPAIFDIYRLSKKCFDASNQGAPPPLTLRRFR